jgi:phosphoglycolate phosphatase
MHSVASHTSLQIGRVFLIGPPNTNSFAFLKSSDLTISTRSLKKRFCSAVSTSVSAMAAKPKTLISFDVDGTLIHSVGPTANKLHKEAFAAAFRQVFDIDTTIDVVPHHGSTDPLILVKVLEFHGISEAKAMASLPEMQQAMINHFLEHKDRAATGLEVLPGVVELLTALQQRDDVAVCLVTGNLEPIGWMKMDKLGIKHLFTEPNFGGFGSDYCSGNTEGMGWRDRAELVRIAALRCTERCGSEVGARFHVGDAPMDVKAAKEAGAHPIGVITGIYTSEQLEEACPSATLLKDLGDVENVLKILNLL